MGDEATIRYRLDARSATSRARLTAALNGATAIAPLALIAVLLQRLGYATGAVFFVLIGAVAGLAAARAYLTYTRLLRSLRGLEVALDAEAVVIDTPDARLSVPRELVKRIVEHAGALGGLRIELVERGAGGFRDRSDALERVDVPRGGERFGELRAGLAAWSPIERAPRRSKLVWGAVSVAVVAGVFFLPFLLEDVVAKSRWVAVGIVLGVWLVARFVLRRR